MAITDVLVNYVKRHSSMDGPDGLYVGGELDRVSASVNLLNDTLKAVSVQTIPLTQLATIVTGSFLGNFSGSTAVPSVYTATQVTAQLNVFTATLKGLTPSPGSSTGKFLRDDATWAAVSLAGLLVNTNNLSDVSSVATSRTNLGLAIGTDVLAYDAQLTATIRQNAQTASYTAVLTDGEKHIYFSGTTAAQTITIPANASVAYPIGTAISIVNDATVSVSIAITTDTLVWSPTGATGSRTLAAGGMVTALKVGTTRWFISGTGLT